MIATTAVLASIWNRVIDAHPVIPSDLQEKSRMPVSSNISYHVCHFDPDNKEQK